MRRAAGAFRLRRAAVAAYSAALADPARGQPNRTGGAGALGWGPARGETAMARLLGITGSLRAGSFNTALLRNALNPAAPKHLPLTGETLDVTAKHA